MLFPATIGVVELLDDSPIYSDSVFPSTKGIIIASSITPDIEIKELFPADGSYNISPFCSISFVIAGATYLLATDISVEVNNVMAIDTGVFVNGYSGSIFYDSILESLKVIIAPNDEFPNFVGWTLTLQYPDPYQTVYNYTFKTKTIQQSIKTSFAVKKLYANKAFVFAVTEEGLDIVDIRTTQNKSYVLRPGGFTSVWCKQTWDATDCLYLGTENDGVFKLLMSDVLRGGDVSQYLSTKFTTGTTPSLPSNNIISIHGFQNKLVILTPNDIVYINLETTKYTSTLPVTISSGFVFLTSTDDLYYTTTNGLHVKYLITGNWVSPDYTYSTTSSPSIDSNIINGLFVAPATGGNADYYNNTIFLATANGLFVINENKGSEATGTKKSFGNAGKTYNLLQSDVCTALWADNIEVINEGRVYLGDASGTFYILHNKHNTVLYQYDVDSGNFGEFLNASSLKSITSLF
jgi:hypothetical protein